MATFSYNELAAAISPARASRYLNSTFDPITGTTDQARALRLYEFNNALSTAAWSTIADVEVIVRNIIADSITDLHSTVRPSAARWYDGPSWFTHGQWFAHKTTKKIAEAMRRSGDRGISDPQRAPAGRVIAELDLGFWRYLLTSRYEHTLWNPAIRSQFPALSRLSGSDSRKLVYHRIEQLNHLRNRIAHHEPIYEPFTIPNTAPVNAIDVLDSATELVSWNNPNVALWIQDRETYTATMTQRP